MILSGKRLLAAIKQREIEITPFDPASVGACSVDFSLGEHFRVYRGKKKRIVVANGVDYSDYSTPVHAPKGLLVKSGELVLGATKERLKLSNKLVGVMQGRSSLARLGLAVHVSSSLVQPGVDNVQVLEIVNNSPHDLFLVPGLKICQIVFEEATSPAAYRGKFSRQSRP